MLLKSIKLTNFLSFGESADLIELLPLNVVIGPNGSGKSNLIEAIELIRSAPSTSEKSNFLAVIRDGGGVRDWLWKGAAKTPWQHLKQRDGDGWDKPAGAADNDCHLMVQVMESWFMADRQTLKDFFGQDFKENKLPASNRSIETVDKSQVYTLLKQATRECKLKGEYGKGEHSFKLLASIDPAKVIKESPWAERFIEQLKKKMEN